MLALVQMHEPLAPHTLMAPKHRTVMHAFNDTTNLKSFSSAVVGN